MNEINPPKCTELDYINFLVASLRVFSCTEASKCSFIDSNGPAHDSFTFLLLRQLLDTEALWEEVKDLVTREMRKSYLINIKELRIQLKGIRIQLKNKNKLKGIRIN